MNQSNCIFSAHQAEFSLSKFRLKVSVLHTIHSENRTIKFRLNPKRTNPVFSDAHGFWHVEEPSDRPTGYSRVYLSASIVASRLLPPFFLDYAAMRALPRASMWIQPYFCKEEAPFEWSWMSLCYVFLYICMFVKSSKVPPHLCLLFDRWKRRKDAMVKT